MAGSFKFVFSVHFSDWSIRTGLSCDCPLWPVWPHMSWIYWTCTCLNGSQGNTFLTWITEVNFTMYFYNEIPILCCISYVYFHVICSKTVSLWKLIMYFFSFHRLTRNLKACRSLPTSLVVFAALKLHLMNKQSWLKFISSHSFHHELKSCFFQLRNCSNLSMVDHYFFQCCYVRPKKSCLFPVILP